MPDAPTRLAERGGALIEGAADLSRTSMRTRFERLRIAWRSIVQASVAAVGAYVIATDVIGHIKPFFAPVAAIITLGITVGSGGAGSRARARRGGSASRRRRASSC
jgi:hypothetical protein